MKEREYSVVTLENGIEYTEIYRLTNDDNKYVFLSNLDNPTDFCIRKLIKQDNEDYIVKLDSREEFNKVFRQFKAEYLS
jgi:hypothetical protein